VTKTVELKIPDDIEYRVIGNAFGLLIVFAGASERRNVSSAQLWL
jgi:hypothetical protein